MKINSENSTTLKSKILLFFSHKFVYIALISLVLYLCSWPLCISKVDWYEGYERINFLSNKPVKVYFYNRGYIITWLKALEEKLTPDSTIPPSSSIGPAPAPSYHENWINGESFALYASRFYYPLELITSMTEYQSIRFFFITNSDNIKKFNRLSEDEKRLQFNNLSKYHGKLFYLDNSSSTSAPFAYNNVDPSFFQKYDRVFFKFFINSNTELKPGCCGQSGDGFDQFCYNNSTYDKMMLESLNFVGWYNQYSVTNPTVKMIESKRYR